jgi:hypothetical protein
VRVDDAREQHDLAHAAHHLDLLHRRRRHGRVELERVERTGGQLRRPLHIDPGNATTIGHRRWVLSNSLGPIGIGGTDKASCMWTLVGTGKAGKPWMAWPAAGIIPLQAVSPRGTTVDSTGWTVQSDTINLANAQVTVTVDGAAQPVTVTQLDQNYGAKYAIRFNPMGWTTQAGKTYAVAVSGIPTAINYTVQIVDCP